MRNLFIDPWGCLRGWCVVALMATFVAVLFGALYLAAKADVAEMQRQHCSATGAERSSFYIQYIYDAKGNISSMYPVYYTEYEYKCDDFNRWR